MNAWPKAGVLLAIAVLGVVIHAQDEANLDRSSAANADAHFWQTDVALIELEDDEREGQAVCAGASCGLCNQPCADACCGSGVKPPCCAQHQTPKIDTSYLPPRTIATTPCPSCDLCPAILTAAYVDPDVAKCCNAVPCGSVTQIENTAAGSNATSTNGTNPYGANWTYEKHVKKHGVDIQKFAKTPIQKAAAAIAAKDSEAVATQMHSNHTPAVVKSNETLNTSSSPGVPVILLPPNVTAKDWEMPATKVDVSLQDHEWDNLLNSMPRANMSKVESPSVNTSELGDALDMEDQPDRFDTSDHYVTDVFGDVTGMAAPNFDDEVNEA